MNKLANVNYLIEQNRSQNMCDKKSYIDDLVKQAKSIKKIISKTEKELNNVVKNIKMNIVYSQFNVQITAETDKQLYKKIYDNHAVQLLTENPNSLELEFFVSSFSKLKDELNHHLGLEKTILIKPDFNYNGLTDVVFSYLDYAAFNKFIEEQKVKQKQLKHDLFFENQKLKNIVDEYLSLYEQVGNELGLDKTTDADYANMWELSSNANLQLVLLMS